MAAVLSPSSPISAAALYTKLRWPSGVRTAFERKRWSSARGADRAAATAGSSRSRPWSRTSTVRPARVAAAHLEPVEGGRAPAGSTVPTSMADHDGSGPTRSATPGRWGAGRARPPRARPSGGASAALASSSDAARRRAVGVEAAPRRRAIQSCDGRADGRRAGGDARGRGRAGRRRRWPASRRVELLEQRRRPSRRRRRRGPVPSSARWTARQRGRGRQRGVEGDPGAGPAHEGDDAAHAERSLPVGPQAASRRASTAATDGRASRPAAVGGLGRRSGASTITRTSGSVPLGRDEHAPVVAELGLHRRDLVGQRRRRGRIAAGGDPHVAQHLRQPGHGRVGQLAERSARALAPRRAAARPVSRPSPVVARSAKITWPLCSPPSDRPSSASASST